ncbi:MAG: DUF3696 domain-containing protein [Bacteroidetes bacterium]|nr:DUF3696 domain-containing protein [Bacteroidota bacterium]
MITQLSIKNFKAHKAANLEPLGKLNVLTGLNGFGKSSVIQSLLLLRQSYLKNNVLSQGLDLNGDLVAIGTGSDAFHKAARSDEFLEVSFALENGQQLTWKFEKGGEDFLQKTGQEQNADLKQISLFNKRFQYLGAEHISPKESSSRSTPVVVFNRQVSEKYGRGEYAVHFLAHYGSKFKPHTSMQHPAASGDSLAEQVDAWLGEISPGIKAVVIDDPTKNETSLRFKYASSEPGIEHEFKPQNTGFGISYALPVVVAMLAAEPGSLILLENPEAHLHPYGQAKLAELLALAAIAGVQLFVETHSDHIINGILVAIKKSESNGNMFNEEMAHIFYFDRPLNSLQSTITPVPIRPGGRILNPPPGFFDQIGKDLKILMGF